ncbi:MAG: hypothetical protein VB032_03295 [Burkholderiaceae bacterium]|nr:hypothetical protein [Burkholderiaceae bacterium]
MTRLKRKLFCLLFLALPLFAIAETGSGSAHVKAPLPQAERPIPVELLGNTIEIRTGITRNEAKAMLSAIMPEVPTVDLKEMLQYDVQLVPGTAPVALVSYFDSQGNIERFVLDAYLKEQNPPAVKLIAWLNAQGIKPIKKYRERTIWRVGCWKIEHTDGGDGDDSAYRIELIRMKPGRR